MMRVLIAFVAVLVAVLAVVFDQPWLYGAAAVVLAGALGYLALHFWSTYTTRSSGTRSGSSAVDDSLEALGIMDVRPQDDGAAAGEGPDDDSDEAPREATAASDDEGGAERERASTDGTSTDGTSTDGASTDGAAMEAIAEEEPVEATADEWLAGVMSEADMDMSGGASTPVHSHERPVLGPFLESLRAAIGAQSVGVIVQEEVTLEYQIEALASVQPDVQHTGAFETREPLLTATMSRQPVTVRSLDEAGRNDLAYYGTVPAIAQVAVAPVSRPETSDTVFLLADATAEVDLGASQVRSLLTHFADTVALLLDVGDAGVERGGTRAADGADASGAADEAQSPAEAAVAAEPDDEAEAPPRPRREIIAEEMQAADAAGDELALVLVHLNRAESIARRGPEAVDSAEQHLRSRLEDIAPGRRVERFGELTYGIFVRSGVAEVESWAADLQDTMAREAGELEGGVSVGVAVRDERHDPEALRTDATDALLEAYETGTCTIIA